MEVVDAQVHLNQLLPSWRSVDMETAIEAGIATMDAVGVDSALIAESRGFDSKMRPALGPELPNGAIRAQFPFSERAVELHPDRFGYLVRIDIKDPELERLVAEIRQKPGALCLRIVPVPDIGEVDALQRGDFEPLFRAAEQHDVPVFCWLPGRGRLLEPYLTRFPRLQFILDHCGVGVAPPPTRQISITQARSVTVSLEDRLLELEQVIAMARFPNLSLKWCHAPAFLSQETYPFHDTIGHLRRVIATFGADRVMWASDFTVSRADNHSWSESLHYLRDSDALSETEKGWLLGGTVRKILRWPKKGNSA